MNRQRCERLAGEAAPGVACCGGQDQVSGEATGAVLVLAGGAVAANGSDKSDKSDKSDCPGRPDQVTGEARGAGPGQPGPSQRRSHGAWFRL